MKRLVIAAISFSSQALGQAMVNEATISTDAALQVANGALALCRQSGQKVTVSVVDHAGREKVRVRDDGASPHSEVHAFRKAYTALTYKGTSAEYGKRVSDGRPIGPLLLPNITTAAGGVPIKAGDVVVGTVGVSGTPASGGGGAHDAKCAEAGIQKIKF